MAEEPSTTSTSPQPTHSERPFDELTEAQRRKLIKKHLRRAKLDEGKDADIEDEAEHKKVRNKANREIPKARRLWGREVLAARDQEAVARHLQQIFDARYSAARDGGRPTKAELVAAIKAHNKLTTGHKTRLMVEMKDAVTTHRDWIRRRAQRYGPNPPVCLGCIDLSQ